ncbi:conjugal transfer protein [Sphingobium yanoikuyae]|uniref:Conjugal transfer protein n=2 Tax=Sphingobium yanoikuyae TaxID=13690 RepID=A0AA42X356_SPHYA|nr:conjugal transfer protein [Sphingobium yanoikuyae]MDH2134599.1 conjugal transfer protein [Sphingobium yanoikuyae]MDH2170000.1 conjugal transfer protein [Sphingobium yanoikuyae]
MSRSAIRLPDCPVSQYRPRGRTRRVAIAMATSLVLLAGCTTFGTNIKGSFACGAPLGGSCAPATVIDDKALAEISGETSYRPAGPFQAPLRQAAPQRIAYAAPAQASGVGPQKVLRIVFPAHVDGAGRYHETSVVQAVVDNGQWLAATDGHGPALAATQVLNVSPEILSQLGTPIPPSASAPAQAPATAPASVAPAPPANAVGAPSAAAVAAARAKAREAAVGKGVPVAARSATPAPAPVAAKPKGNSPEFASGSPANRPASFSPRVED